MTPCRKWSASDRKDFRIALGVRWLRSFCLALMGVVWLPVGVCAAQDAEVPTANPARPTVTNPVHFPTVGYLQFEQGVVQSDGSPGLSGQTSVVQTTKLALDKHFLVQVQSQPFAYTEVEGGPSAKDQGDLILGGQVMLREEKDKHKDRVPTVSVGYNARVRTGSSPDLDMGSFSQGLLVLASANYFGLHFGTNLVTNEQTGASAAGRTVRRAQFGQTLAATRQLPKNVSLTGEVWHFTQPLVVADRAGRAVGRANAVGVLGAAGYAVRPNLVLDAGMEHGVTSTSTAWQGFAGVTYLLPRRLWREKR